MCKSIFLIVSLLLSQICIAQIMNRNNEYHFSSNHGTCIIAIPYNEGLGLCSDKRMVPLNGTKDSEPYTDTAVKLFSIENKVVYTAAGYPSFSAYESIQNSRSERKIDVYDVFQAIETFFKSVSPQKLTESKGLLVTALEKEVNKNSHLLVHSPLPNGADQFLFDVAIFFYDSNELLNFYLLTCTYLKSQGVFKALIMLRSAPAAFSLKAKPFIIGERMVVESLTNTPLPKYQGLKISPKQLKMLQGQVLSKEVSQNETIALGEQLINVTSRYNKQFNGEDNVSTVCDCAILTRSGGFKWIKKN